MKLTKTQKVEYDRLKKGPQKGWYTFLHHDGPVAEQSDNLMERIDYIVNNKPQKEILIRLRHIWPVPSAAGKIYADSHTAARKIYKDTHAATWKIYENSYADSRTAARKIYKDTLAAAMTIYTDTLAAAWKIYEDSRTAAEKIYADSHAAAAKPLLALVPNCKWNSETILE